MDICESSLSEDNDLFRLASMATNWLEATMTKKGYWGKEAPPYGGDVTSEDYFTSLALRALIAFCSLETPFFSLEITRHAYQESAIRARFFGRMSLVAVLLALASMTFLLRESISAVVEVSSSLVSVVIVFISIAASIITLYEFMRQRLTFSA
jgi:hypothetical protein